VSNYLDCQKDDYKQLSLMEHFKSSEVMKNNTAFLFVDEARNLNARYRTYFFYEYLGMMVHVFNDETRFGSEPLPYSLANISNYQYLKRFKNRDYVERSPQYVVIIEKGSYDIDYGEYYASLSHLINLFRLMLDERFDRDRFNQNIRNVVKLDYEKIE